MLCRVMEGATNDVTEGVKVTNGVTERVTESLAERVTKSMTERVTKNMTEKGEVLGHSNARRPVLTPSPQDWHSAPLAKQPPAEEAIRSIYAFGRGDNIDLVHDRPNTPDRRHDLVDAVPSQKQVDGLAEAHKSPIHVDGDSVWSTGPTLVDSGP